MSNIAQGPPSDAGGRAGTAGPMTGSGQTTRQATEQVTASATEQGRQVMAEAGYQARGLMHQARSEVSGQAGVQKKRAVEGLYAFGDELGKLADRSEHSGPATQLAQHASTKVGQAARWLDEREPGQVVDEVKAYARRNPGMFLLGAAVLGALAGRLTRNLVQEHHDQDEWTNDRAVASVPPPPGSYPTQPTAPFPPQPGTGYPTQPTTSYPPANAYPASGSAAVPGAQPPPMGGVGPEGEVQR
jgi:hypothetical protein